MIFALAQFIAKLTGFDISKVQRWVLWILIGIVLFAVLLFGYCVTGWFKKTPKLDEAEIQKGEAAVKAANDEELRKILVNSDVKEILANDANSKAGAVNAISNSKQTWDNANRDELQAEFNRRAGR